MLVLSAQAFYAWNKNPTSCPDLKDAYAINALVDAHGDDPAFGYRFLADELERAGIVIGERRAWRLFFQQKLWPTTVKKGCEGKRPGSPVNDDLLRRDSIFGEPNRKWVIGLIEYPTAEGKVYCCAIKNRRRVTGAIGSDRPEPETG